MTMAWLWLLLREGDGVENFTLKRGWGILFLLCSIDRGVHSSQEHNASLIWRTWPPSSSLKIKDYNIGKREQFACDLLCVQFVKEDLGEKGRGEKFKLPAVMSCFTSSFLAPGKILLRWLVKALNFWIVDWRDNIHKRRVRGDGNYRALLRITT